MTFSIVESVARTLHEATGLLKPWAEVDESRKEYNRVRARAMLDLVEAVLENRIRSYRRHGRLARYFEHDKRTFTQEEVMSEVANCLENILNEIRDSREPTLPREP